MGLLEKALTELEAGHPRKGPGLFVKALKARASSPAPEDDSLTGSSFSSEPDTASESPAPQEAGEQLAPARPPVEAELAELPDFEAELPVACATPFVEEAPEPVMVEAPAPVVEETPAPLVASVPAEERPARPAIEEIPAAELGIGAEDSATMSAPIVETEVEAALVAESEPEVEPVVETAPIFEAEIEEEEAAVIEEYAETEPAATSADWPASIQAEEGPAPELVLDAEETESLSGAPERYPFPASAVDELAKELSALDLTEDAVLAAYARIAEALPLTRLALLAMGRAATVLCSDATTLPPSCSSLDLSAEDVPEGGKGRPFPSALRERLPSGGGDDMDAGILRIQATPGPRAKAFSVWLYSDKRIDGDEALVAAFSRLFESCPAPSGDPFALDELSPGIAALRLPLGAGRATVLRFDLSDFMSGSATLLPGVRREALLGVIARGFSSILGSDGKVFWLEGNQMVAALFSKEAMDSELALFQFGKSLRRAFPFLSSSGFPAGKAIGIDLASSGALEAFERFVSE